MNVCRIKQESITFLQIRIILRYEKTLKTETKLTMVQNGIHFLNQWKLSIFALVPDSVIMPAKVPGKGLISQGCVIA